MPKKSPAKKEPEPAKSEPPFHHKKLGYRTPDRFKRLVFRRNPSLTTQHPRSLGGHR